VSEGKKYDGGKPRMGLIDRHFKRVLAEVLTFGAKKYAAWNWAKGMDWSRLIDAAYRHLDAWVDGENIDPESGISHLGHLACCVMFLTAYEARGLGNDDRPKWAPQIPEDRQSEGSKPLIEVLRPMRDGTVAVRCRLCGWETPEKTGIGQTTKHAPLCGNCGPGKWYAYRTLVPMSELLGESESSYDPPDDPEPSGKFYEVEPL